jgi:hypothetical protein
MKINISGQVSFLFYIIDVTLSIVYNIVFRVETNLPFEHRQGPGCSISHNASLMFSKAS